MSFLPRPETRDRVRGERAGKRRGPTAGEREEGRGYGKGGERTGLAEGKVWYTKKDSTPEQMGSLPGPVDPHTQK